VLAGSAIVWSLFSLEKQSESAASLPNEGKATEVRLQSVGTLDVLANDVTL